MDYIDRVYYTVMGEMEESDAVPGVESAFLPGSVCDRAYEQVYAACERLRQRLGASDEVADVEVILGAMLTICREVGRRMYRQDRGL